MPDPFYAPRQSAELQEGYWTVNPAYERLLAEYLSLRLANEAAYEYARHGFVPKARHLEALHRKRILIRPPERNDMPKRDECLDLAINLQSFMFNVFGCIDNLAWIWVKDRQLTDNRGRPLRDQQVGLRAGCIAVRSTFSTRFQEYLTRSDVMLTLPRQRFGEAGKSVGAKLYRA
jgi:hypothetical protein